MTKGSCINNFRIAGAIQTNTEGVERRIEVQEVPPIP
jgi:hypothetical protein